MSKHNHKAKKKKNPIVEEINLEIAENSIKKAKLNIKTFPLTEKQKLFLRLALDKDTKIIFVRGPSGSAKSFTAIYAALRILSERPETLIKYVRTTAESGERSSGFLPGSLELKTYVFNGPLYDKLSELLLPLQVDELLEDKTIEPVIVNYLRGASFRDMTILADECQNYSTKELITLVTRIGNGTKMILTGDPDQSDIGNKSGFQEIYNLFDTPESVSKGIHCFEFLEEDILRSEILKYIVSVFKKLPTQNNSRRGKH